MVRVRPTDLAEDDQDLLDYLSDDSDLDENNPQYTERLHEKFNEIEPLVTLDTTFPMVAVIVGIPKVGSDSFNKLKIVLEKRINEVLRSKGGELTGNPFDLYIPQAENGSTSGHCFLSFTSAFDATHAVKSLNNLALDAKHKFKAALLDEVDMIVSRDDKFRSPMKMLGFTREKFRWWLHDHRGREQFFIRYDDETEIYWHDPVEREPVLEYNGHRERAEGKRVWTDFRVQWSPQGSYLATFHKPGIALWAGDNFEKKVRFEHKDVKRIDFSPNENYLISWDGSPATLKKDRSIRVWKVMTGELLRSFATPDKTPRGTDFPHFVWSHDDRFVARMALASEQSRPTPEINSNIGGIKTVVPDTDLFVYELPEMTLTKDRDGQKYPLRYPFDKFDWSPGDNILSVWIPATTDSPGRLLLIEMPSRTELASKNVYNVEDASMHWQEKGDFLCLRTAVVKKTGKKGRKKITQLEIFRIREKNIPIDNIQIEDSAVKQLHWEEGYSKRFALIVQEELTHNQAVWFYRVCDNESNTGGAAASKKTDVSSQSIRRGGDTQRVCIFEISHFMNFMKWSPHGSHFMLASMGTDGILYFCALNDQDKVEILHKDEHFMVNEIKWSSCGRYVTTAVSIPMIASGSTSAYRLCGEAGYNIWTFQGKLHHQSRTERFYQFYWRPHPPSLLTRSQIDNIKKNIKEFSRKYDLQDDSIKEKQRGAWLEEREKEMNNFWNKLNELYQWQKQLPDYYDWVDAIAEFEAQFEWDDREEVIEEEIDSKEEVIGI